MATPVTDFYRGKTILITGATGFVGKVLIEKLLYSCSDLKKIYIITRAKKGKTINTRIHEMWELPMFQRLRKEKPEAMAKIFALDGDLMNENFGLKESDLNEVQKEVNVIFHCAATVKFNADLKEAIQTNTCGTWILIQIAKTMKQLDVFVYFSTAFCYVDLDVLDHKVHSANEDPHDVMHMIKWMKDDALKAVTPQLLGKHPNTYTYSKRLSECLIRDEYQKLPVGIARPSIVLPAWSEPVEGWVDSFSGPIGVLLAAGKGFIRTMNCDGDCKIEFIPVDLSVNSLIVFGSEVGNLSKNSPEIPVCNITCGDTKDMTNRDVVNLSKSTVAKYPLDYPLWYPGGNIHKNKFIHKICLVLFQLIPAYFVDFLLLVFQQKRFMVRLQNRITIGLELQGFFTIRSWNFKNDVYKELFHNLSPEEKSKFQMDCSVVEEEEYIKRCILGGKQYCLKESLADLPKARRVNFCMYLLDRLVTILFYGYILWMIYSYSEPLRNSWTRLPIMDSVDSV
ncbi:putative fatty acyl-CoA reductase CG5065 [Arctopsyche grandis]|uniref:putative fatty acyl-CoA reductase CG5065 n=1 Tax=Arctopsyche grandis TaxID=121162 RepID=UPI00406D722B